MFVYAGWLCQFLYQSAEIYFLNPEDVRYCPYEKRSCGSLQLLLAGDDHFSPLIGRRSVSNLIGAAFEPFVSYWNWDRELESLVELLAEDLLDE